MEIDVNKAKKYVEHEFNYKVWDVDNDKSKAIAINKTAMSCIFIATYPGEKIFGENLSIRTDNERKLKSYMMHKAKEKYGPLTNVSKEEVYEVICYMIDKGNEWINKNL